jgi:hypothetical protein
MRKITLLILAVFLLTANAIAQETLRVGDVVEYKCNCFGQEWVSAKVEAVEGNTVRVRYGNVRNQVATVTIASGTVRALPKPESARDIQLREAFRADALNKYYQTVQIFAPFFNEKYISGGVPHKPAEWQKMMTDLTELDSLCKGKYVGVTNEPSSSYLSKHDDYQYADWCAIAARRNELAKLARTAAAKNLISPTVTKDNLKFAFNHQKNRVPDETQMLMYDRAKWKQEQIPKYKTIFVEYGFEMPVDFFAEVEKEADELKSLIEQTAPNRAWEPPPFRDAAVEAFIKGKYAADPDYRGAQILKAGLDYKIWEVRKGLSYLGSDSTFRYYKVEYNSYKRGWVLMKLPNQPFCQASEWIVGRGAKGMVVVSLGGSGIFVKCQ